MAFGVVKQHISLGGGMSAVLNQVTGDGSTQTWDTGLRKVMFYTATTADDAHCIADEWYLNYSDGGSTAKDGAVHFDEAAPDDGEVWYCFGIGKL